MADYFARSPADAATDADAIAKLPEIQDFNLSTTEELNGRQRQQPVALAIAAPQERILDSLNHYQPCHIQLPHTERCFFAISVDGEFYSLLKLAPTQESGLTIARHISTKPDKKVVLTKTHQGYAVWLWEPEAQLHLE
ncbi:MAG: hypothetical protein HC881_13105 [Leptolyngbyaceae cyanobacterium SL_7_1]|nr:hypothetical protein [Leptolyngbyaceae cyanobacterium SL_7_1]